MTSLTEVAQRRRRKPWIAILVLGGFAALLLLWWLWPAARLSLGGAAWLLLGALLSGLLLLASVALGWQLGVRLTRQRLGEALRDSRGQLQAWAQLSPDWQWQTDAQHHLVRWQAPQAAPASSWVGLAATQALWERFELVDAPAALLQERLQQHSGFSALRVRARPEQGPAAQFAGDWLLSAQARFDGQGRFDGFCGIARPLREEVAPLVASPAPADLQAAGLLPPRDAGDDDGRLTGWIQSLPGPAWLLSAEPAPATRLLALNGAAAQLMGRPVDQLGGESWLACLDMLPEEVRLAAQTPAAAEGLACGPWWLCLSAAPGGLRLLSLWPQGALDSMPATLAVEAAELARAEQESFSYTVSHDLRAPLRVVEGFARILKEDYGRLLDRVGNDHLDRVMGAATRMHSMIDALLSLTQLSAQPLQRQPVNLSLLAGQVLEELRRSAPERQVRLQIQPDLLVQGDPTLLRMVLENLLGNAWKYSSKCEVAEIRFERQQQGGELVYMVADNGAGFDMRFAERLFGVFQRLHSASDFQGTGVGLASVRRVIHRHGGEIWAEAEVGRGARFYFTLRG